MDFTNIAQICLLVVAITVFQLKGQSAVADELPRSILHPEVGSISCAQDLAQLTWSVLDAIEREHIASYAHDELIEIVTRVLTGLDDGRELDVVVAKATRCQNADEFAEWLCKFWGSDNPPGTSFDQFPDQIITALQTKVGHLRLIRAKDHVVQEQLRNNRYVGIGVAAHSDDGLLVFADVLAGGPADRGGLRDGTVVEEVDGRSTRDVPLETLVDWLRGPMGTDVTLKIADRQGFDGNQTVTLKRGVVRFTSVFNMKTNGGRKTPFIDETLSPDGLDHIAWIKIDDVTSGTLSELRDAEVKARLEGDRVVVLDFRTHSESDDLHQAQLIADGLLDGHRLWYQARRGQQPAPVIADRECLFREFPMVVLVHQSTGPAKCAIAAALQDAGRAKIVGDSPEFMGTIASTVKLDGVSFALKLSTDKLTRSRPDQSWPLRPDFPVEHPGASASYPPPRSHEFDKPQPTIGRPSFKKARSANAVSALLPANVKPKRRLSFDFGIQDELRTQVEQAFEIMPRPRDRFEPVPFERAIAQAAITAMLPPRDRFEPVPLVQYSSVEDIAGRVARELLNALPEDTRQ